MKTLNLLRRYIFCVNPFHATDLVWYPLKTSENLWVSDIFRGYQKRSVAWNGLSHHICLKFQHRYWQSPKYYSVLLTLSWRKSLACRNHSIICPANRWIGFYIITTSVMKELILQLSSLSMAAFDPTYHLVTCNTVNCGTVTLAKILHCLIWNFQNEIKIFKFGQ